MKRYSIKVLGNVGELEWRLFLKKYSVGWHWAFFLGGKKEAREKVSPSDGKKFGADRSYL